MAYYEIPLTSDPDSNFTCTIPIDNLNITLFFRFRYNKMAGCWFFSITDVKSNKLLLDSHPLCTGINLLGQFEYMKIGSAYVILTKNKDTFIPGSYGTQDNPTDDNLGVDYMLVWSDTVVN